MNGSQPVPVGPFGYSRAGLYIRHTALARPSRAADAWHEVKLVDSDPSKRAKESPVVDFTAIDSPRVRHAVAQAALSLPENLAGSGCKARRATQLKLNRQCRGRAGTGE